MRPIAPTNWAPIRAPRPSFRRTAWATNASAVAAPRSSNCGFRPCHISPVKQALDTATKKKDAPSAAHRSPDVWAVREPVPMRLSTGVRNQNKDSAAMVNTNNGQTRCAGANPVATPVNRGTAAAPRHHVRGEQPRLACGSVEPNRQHLSFRSFASYFCAQSCFIANYTWGCSGHK